MTPRELYHTIKQTRDEAQCLAAIATFARSERAEAVAELKRCADHLEAFARDHPDDSTAETWSIIHCANELCARATPSGGRE